MNLKIGTILIAKESRTLPNGIQTTKNKEYPIKDLSKGNLGLISITINDDNGYKWVVSSEEYINQHFTIKRYTISDLQTRTDIMVRIENEEQAKKLQDAGLAFFYKSYYEPYYGFTEEFIWLCKSEQQGRILLESIDEIDLGEGKEEVVNQPFYIQQLESEIARLKGELAELETALRVTTKKLGDATSQDLEKRERMAWELVIKSAKKTSCIGIDSAFEIVDTFLAKSKEVKNDD